MAIKRPNDHNIYQHIIGTIYPNCVNTPNGRKLYQMAGKLTKWPHRPLKVPPKFTLLGFFWFENMPSGNPDPGDLLLILGRK
jgi:hypothetical protein